jgi:hypothetical protein
MRGGHIGALAIANLHRQAIGSPPGAAKPKSP